MRYLSTRGRCAPVEPARAVILGLAPDGGLLLPEKIPALPPEALLETDDIARTAGILSAYFPDIPDLAGLTARAYAGKFPAGAMTPTVAAGDFEVLELFRGPTSAFKDVALSALPHLLAAAKKVCGEKKPTYILTATSGDTGKAALEGFRDVPGTRICVFYPQGGVSQIQRAQMVTQPGENVTVRAVEGNFDDAQSAVKAVFRACRGRALPAELSSANSINIGRLVPQITYYCRAYRDLVDRGRIKMGEKVHFAVPTGNFGDILAGFLAKKMGLPVGKLLCASNANHVLTDFLRTGVYDRRRPLQKTLSPSMDILVSSNLERLLYLLLGDPEIVRGMMEQLEGQGVYQLPEAARQALEDHFWGTWCGDGEALAEIGRIWREWGYLCDPHTAAGFYAAEQYRRQTGDPTEMVVLATASPFKFPAAVLTALGEKPEEADGFRQLRALEVRTGLPAPENLTVLETLPERHTGSLRREEILPFVLDQLEKERNPL